MLVYAHRPYFIIHPFLNCDHINSDYLIFVSPHGVWERLCSPLSGEGEGGGGGTASSIYANTYGPI